MALLWQDYPCELERAFYDLELSGGSVICNVFPQTVYDPSTQVYSLKDFYRHDMGVLGSERIRRVRISDTHSFSSRL